MITAVTTCKGRLAHLQITLPMMLAEFDRVVVVDWSCPEKSGDYAAQLGASVARKNGEQFFDRSAARNFGARFVKHGYLVFVDADTLCMPGSGLELKEKLTPETMVISSRTESNYDIPNLFGFLACDLDAFFAVKGYDESYEGWGHEDSQLRGQLFLEAGLKVARMSPMSLGAISHDNDLRAAYHKEPAHVTSKRNFQKLYQYFEGYGIADWMLDHRTESITFRPDPTSGL